MFFNHKKNNFSMGVFHKTCDRIRPLLTEISLSIYIKSVPYSTLTPN